ncbi:TetR family transcriptional regulator C-terminal domain-containing protein [Streptomyces graminifolii]|uniref:TetR family transcriptional regulator C-terminal domain-containing protein n=1 Tax=Streptomyces graminifolii TaxID=1266771 RepID=UPI004057E1B7
MAGRGLLRPHVDPASLPAGLIALIDGLQVQWLLDSQAIDMPGQLRARLREVVQAEIP